MSTSHQITVTGVLPTPGQMQARKAVRKNIKDLIKDEKQFSLYIQALILMMGRDQSESLSWFGVGGIHGLPHTPWDNAGDKPQWGYCAHATANFPTWHRPYVTLFEQALQGYAVQVANKYTSDKDAWLEAARDLRAPYWDWAQDAIPPAEVIRLQKIQVTTAQGKAEVENPLYSYRFHPIDPSFDSFTDVPTTVRNSQDDDPTKTNVPALIESLQGLNNWLGDGIRAETYKTLVLLKNWKVFSNKGYQPKRGAIQLANSLESIHDIIHVTVGGNGQMADPSYAAFDPIFWLHHSNVDRLLALWQALNPTAGVFAKDGPEGEIANDDLTPFWNGPTTFYKSTEADVSTWTDLNYTYPEFVGLEGQSQDQITTAIRNKVNQLYGARPIQANSPVAIPSSVDLASQAPVAASPVSFLSLMPPAQAGAQAPAAAPTHFVEWYVRIRSKRFEIGKSYTILIFLGEPPENPAQWRTSPNLAGIHAEFVNSHPQGCPNCNDQRDMITEGFVSITESLKHRGFEERPEAEIDAYLKENLHWCIQKSDGSVLSAEDFQSLEIAVLSVPLAVNEADQVLELPAGTLPVHRNVTDGRAGGRSSA
ncbi:Di-copper centre-containing protein [Punctularia strigosozonata HHB-11173 SS5]|uniref:Di-copper centre-containing protein n=1 Tax=Punctularia strigosozonata (strain HHB-11173) TaxID=741275 RepID=UPI0004417F43|nr:Di-copper centre-containing protein [Punctularia strigosozonata HHB-11173 SS5]EIN06741.1 Di-copper centre-containing protein [Punctularia strigosozonata HHB-11173 SS5]